MPIYEFSCKPCNKVVEVLVLKKKDKPRCEICGRKLTKVPWSKPAPFRWGKSGGWV